MKLQSMILTALFAAIVAALGLIPAIPLPFTPVPITAQTLGVMLAGAVLGARLGGASMLLFVLLVAVGAPVLSGGRGSLAVLLGPSGGYILSWPIAAFVTGLLADRFQSKLKLWNMILFNIIGGIIIVYLIGISYLAFVSDMTFNQAAFSALAYIPGDVVKAVVAGVVALQVRSSAPVVKYRESRKRNQTA
ncbi:biotin transporter BioY [Falsibacillus albus]|uniref:Biotin transporter n=1 Tax=Falsibacillus albus TaxID=2478915 RepID=A0A3L7K5I4_9BACI|nr:biotin transporter BioY [Falsibacillus albus]RLQ97331.1 biotin transporter BioY [Falsibacillus albus]